MSILVINSGSTSLKFKLFSSDEKLLVHGGFAEITDYAKAFKAALRQIGDLREIQAVGHRVVHGGDKFVGPTLITEDNLPELEKFNDLAPLHNPFNLAGIKTAGEYLPEIKQIAVFDTAFYRDLPEAARTYALPEEINEKYKIQRYGFHGLSHKYVLQEAAKRLKKDPEKTSLISCHLGGGASITAVKNGKPIDTSMGLTPLEGLVMMSRPGDLDAGIIFELLKNLPGEIDAQKVESLYDLLNNRSGILGLTGSKDFQKLLSDVSLGRAEAKLAFELFTNRLVKYIGAYWAELEGRAEAIVFTGAIGSGNPLTRNTVMKKVKCLGDVPMLAIETNEELMIMREVKALMEKQK